MTPLASNPTPQPHERRHLTLALPIPPRTAALRCVVALGRSDRVHLRLELLGLAASPEAEPPILDALTARMGVTLWRQVVMPAIRTHAAALRLRCEVREVLALGGGSPTPAMLDHQQRRQSQRMQRAQAARAARSQAPDTPFPAPEPPADLSTRRT